MRRLWGLAVLLAGPMLWADDEGTGRGVARVSLINGDVTMQRGDSGDWIAAAVNAPLVTGDKIYAARASRAEVQLDYANFLRIGQDTEVRLADLEGRRHQLQVSRGILTFRVLRSADADVEINTLTVAIRPLKRGIYRIDVQPSGETEITVRDGEAEILSSQGSERLPEGRTMIVRQGPGDRALEVQVVRAPGRDDWDRWNDRRDEYLERSRSYRYVHPSVYGAEDLDDYGSWYTVDNYGSCWFPRPVFAGWSPYSYGRWVWVDWYGWTWVGYEPWGWAPYHHGRWFHHARYGWGWYPGGVHVRSYWSPALVGFFGWGRHSGVSIGVGFGYSNIGWAPLAPGERYYPWYGRGYYGGRNRVFINNSVNVTNITNVYRNGRVSGGLVSVGADDFARGRVSNPRRVDVRELRDVAQVRGMVPVTPQKESLRVVDRDVQSTVLPGKESREMRFFTRREPSRIEKVPFAEQQQQISQAVRGEKAPVAEVGRRTDNRQGLRRVGEDRPSAIVSPPIREDRRGGAAALAPKSVDKPIQQKSDSWRRFGDERREGPRAVEQRSPKPAVIEEKRFDSGAGYRRYGQMEQQSREAPRSEPPERRSIQREERRMDQGGGRGRPLEINRPILMDRRHDSGGGRNSSPPPNKSVDRSDRGGRDGGGKQINRAVGR